MSRLPDAPHATHDLELVAAYAAGDAAGADLDAATILVGGCADCATLHRDLRSIAAALPLGPAPLRSRDFRLTPEQAAALRPRGWRRFAAVLAGPGFRFAAPLGTGLATLGIAGLLLGTLGLALPGATATSGSAGVRAGATALDSNESTPTEKTTGSSYALGVSAAPSVAASIVDQAVTNPGAASLPLDSPIPAALAPTGSEPPPVPADGPTGGDPGLRDLQPASSPLLPPAGVALVAGFALLAARIAGRRLTRGA